MLKKWIAFIVRKRLLANRNLLLLVLRWKLRLPIRNNLPHSRLLSKSKRNTKLFVVLFLPY